ncbi:MAG TPA: cell division protein, partial [Ureibacillus sp.]|nr:cell division protein [Ureibacillus sp.]
QGATYELKPIVKINNKICSLDHELKDRDSLQVETIQTIEEVLKYLKKTELLQKLQSFYVTIDGKPVLFPEFTSKLLLNGKPCKLQYPVNDGDSIAIEKSEGATVEMVANKLNLVLEEKIVVSFQGEVLELTKLCREVVANGEVVPASQSVLNGASLSIVEKDTSPWIYQDVFRFSNWQIPVSFKGKFTILRNGKASSFDEEIFGGDQLEIILTEESVVK